MDRSNRSQLNIVDDHYCLYHYSGDDMTSDEQEALSRKYSDDVILLLPLKSGDRVAVFNNARELCGFFDLGHGDPATSDFERIMWFWHPPTKPATRPIIDLTELGLL